MNLIHKDITVNLNNTSENKLLGLDNSGKVGFHNSFNTYGNNLWNKGEVDNRGFFTLTSLTTQKNLIATNKTDFGLIEKGVFVISVVKSVLKSDIFPFFHLYRS